MIMNNNNENMELENANDMELFLNYTQFVQMFLNKICKQYKKKKINAYFVQFQSWTMLFIETVITISNETPIISGLYKILKTIFSLFATSNKQIQIQKQEEKDNDDNEEEEEDILMLDDNNNNNNIKEDCNNEILLENNKFLNIYKTKNEHLFRLLFLKKGAPASF
eukprot:70196_1